VGSSPTVMIVRCLTRWESHVDQRVPFRTSNSISGLTG